MPMHSADSKMPALNSAKPPLPTELAAIALVFCVGGGAVLLMVPMAAVLLAHRAFPDPAIQALFNDPASRGFIGAEGIGAVLLAFAAVNAGSQVFARVSSAGYALRAAIVFAIVMLVGDVIVQGWLLVPSLRMLAPSLKAPQRLIYDPRLRPTLPLVIGVVVLGGLLAVAQTLRRPHVREALRSFGKRNPKRGIRNSQKR